jgi:hypothetical protein
MLSFNAGFHRKATCGHFKALEISRLSGRSLKSNAAPPRNACLLDRFHLQID